MRKAWKQTWGSNWVLLEKFMLKEVVAITRRVKVEKYLWGRRNSIFLLKVEHTQKREGRQGMMRTRVKGEWLKTGLQLLYCLCYKCHYSHTDHFIFREVIEWMFSMHDRNLQTELGAVAYFIRTPTRWFLHLTFSYLIMEMFSPWKLCKGGREDQLHKVVFWPLHRCHIICTPPPPALSVRELRESGFSSPSKHQV